MTVVTPWPLITASVEHRPASAACSGPGCRWSESEPSESPDMQDVLRGKAVAHVGDCGHPVTITVMSVMTIAPAVPGQR